MGKFLSAPLIAAAFLMTFTAAPVWAAHVTITPLGSHTGEFCDNDRALLFEDPDGTTLLYDPGRTILGGDDERLPHTGTHLGGSYVGTLDVILLSSVHSDHIGDQHPDELNDGDCGDPTLDVDNRPQSTVDLILDEHGADIFVGGEMSKFFNERHSGQAKTLLEATRSHWSIENNLHWTLDVTFREDLSRVRKDHGPQNLAVLRQIALNLLKKETTLKRGIQGKRLKAGGVEDYLLRVLLG